jgi:hypothetical protein
MTDLTTDEMAERIIRSLKENSAELARELRAERHVPYLRIAVKSMIFVAGLAASVLLGRTL